MTVLLHALANLARLRWLGVAFCVLAMLCSTTQASALTEATTNGRVNATAGTATTASANEREQAKTRVGGFHQNPPLNAWYFASASAETQLGISSAPCETALAFSHAARGVAGALARVELNIGKHAVKQMAERGINESMIKAALENGTRFIDPKNGTINYVLKEGFASGKDLLVGTNPLTGKITTVIRGTDLIAPRFIPIAPP